MDADTDVVLAGCVGYEGELRLVVASGLGAAEVGVGVDAALDIGLVGDIEPPAELERAAADADATAAPPGAGPIFRGARPTGGGLVDMTAAILRAVILPSQVFLFVLLLFSRACTFPALLFLVVGDNCLSDRSSDGEWNAHVTVGRGYWCNAPNPVGYRFIGRLWCQGRQQQQNRPGSNNELTIDDAIDFRRSPV